MPVCVGVGVSTPEQAAEVCEVADGVVVGSALVRRLLEGGGPEAAATFVASLRRRDRLGPAPEPPRHRGSKGVLSRGCRVGGAPHVTLEVVLGRLGGGRREVQGRPTGKASVSRQALAATMCSASAASVVSASGSPENDHGSAVHMPWPSKHDATSTRRTLVTSCARASATAAAIARFSLPRTSWAAHRCRRHWT